MFKRSDLLSPLDLLQRAAVISALFLVLHLVGLRECTSILSGTVGSLGSLALGWRWSAALAFIYILAYLAFVVLVPILVLAAIILAVPSFFRRGSARSANQGNQVGISQPNRTKL